MKKQLKKLIKGIMYIPSVFMHNGTRRQLYRLNVNRLLNSIRNNNEIDKFKNILKNLTLTKAEKRRAIFQFKLLFYFTGMCCEDYFDVGGLYGSSFRTKFRNNASRWRQNIFQYSVNQKDIYGNTRKLDDKVEFNKTFADFIHREWIMSDDTGLEDFIKQHNTVIIKPIDGSSGVGIHSLNYEQFLLCGGS